MRKECLDTYEAGFYAHAVEPRCGRTAKPMSQRFFILDGHAQIYRAFFAPFRDLTSPTGEPTRATHVFCQMLFNLIREQKPDYLAMAMDISDETVFRRDIDADYKANREPAPEALHQQADRIVEIVTALGIPIYRVPGFEADDVLATICHTLADSEVEVFLVSKDKDLEQLITDRTRLFDMSSGTETDGESLFEKKGYTPEQAIEIQSLSGDTTDNIPGVPGIGTKTAAKLVNKYGSALAVIEHADELTPKMKQNVQAFAEQLPITRQLVTLRRDVPLSFTLEDCRLNPIRIDDALPIFDELGFGRLKTTLLNLASPGVDVPDGSVSAGTPAPQDAPPIEADAGPHKYDCIDTPAKLRRLAKALGKQRIFAFDTETTGLNPVRSELVGLSFCYKAGEACYVPVRAAMGPALPVDEVVEQLKDVFENPKIHKIGQNLKYDMVVVRQVGIRVAGVHFDTMIASALLDPLRSSHGLDALSRTLLGHRMIPITDLIGKGKNQITIDQVDSSVVSEYACEDADYTWRLYEHFQPQIDGGDFATLFSETEMPLVEVLATMEHNGIALDSPLLNKLSATIATRMVELTDEVHKAAGYAFNIDSTKQLAVVLFDEQELPVIRKTKTGRSTDADTLHALVEQTDNKIPTLVLEYRELAKLKNTYTDTLPKMVCERTGRIHAGFHQTGAVTGRLSSSDPNLQNIPIRTATGKRIREAFVAGDADRVLLTADYSQVELRLLAHFCQDKTLMAAFKEGQDIHRAVAAKINGVELAEVTSEQRSAAKAVNFGIIYGQTAFGLARGLGIGVGEAKAFIDTYFSQYSGIRQFIDQCIDDAKRTGYAQTILGRRRPVEGLTSRNRNVVSAAERVAVNTVVQGSAADLIKRAMVDIHRELDNGAHDAQMLLQVHDELVFEVPRAQLEPISAMVRDKMENALPLTVPVVVDVAWGSTWAEGKP